MKKPIWMVAVVVIVGVAAALGLGVFYKTQGTVTMCEDLMIGGKPPCTDYRVYTNIKTPSLCSYFGGEWKQVRGSWSDYTGCIKSAKESYPPGLEKQNSDPRNTTYIIDGNMVNLKNGVSEISMPTLAAKKVTTIFDATTKGDLNADGKDDYVVILTQTTGGSGTFYYAAAALSTPTGYVGTNAILLGDRIAPQTTEIRNAIIIVNYADRKPDEPMTAQPSVGVSKYMQLKGTELTEIVVSNDMIHVGIPSIFQNVSSPLTVSGEARGNWYFEASFPVKVLDANMNELASTPAQAQGDWMTTNFVPFSATLTFTATPGTNGWIVFKKDNPSDLPENDAQIMIPVVF